MGRYDKLQKEPGASRRVTLNAMEALKYPRVDTKNVKEIEERISKYLDFCVEHDVPPSIAGCANWLGVTIKTLENWYTGQFGTPEHQRTMMKFYGIVQDIWAQMMADGSLQSISGIFMSKVFFGYKDTTEVIVQHKHQDQLSNADLIAESKLLPGAETFSLPESGQTIDADFKVVEDKPTEEKPIEYNPGYEKAVARRKHKEVTREMAIDRHQRHNEYMREYMKEYKKKLKAKKLAEQAAQAEQTQKQHDDDLPGQTTLNFDN